MTTTLEAPTSVDPRDRRGVGPIRHDEIDRLLADAGDGRRFDRRVSELCDELRDVAILPSDDGPSRTLGQGAAEFGFLVRGLPYGDPLPTYVREVAAIPRMERDDEVRVARRLELVRTRVERVLVEFGVSSRRARKLLADSRALATIGDGSRWLDGVAAEAPTDDEIATVRRVLAEYGTVRQEFIERNLHLVIAASAPYRTYGIPLLDLIQEGNAGLIRAVEKFDWRKNVRFRTYATFWIRQAVERAIAHSKGIVRVPNYLQQKMRRLRREGLIPRRSEEISIIEVSKAFDLPPQVVGRLLETERAIRSLDQVVGEDGEERLGSSIAAEEPLEPELFDWEEPLLKSRLDEVLGELSDHEREILEYRFGIGREGPMTLEEVGRLMKVSRERVRQLQVRAIRKLQAPGVIERLAAFV